MFGGAAEEDVPGDGAEISSCLRFCPVVRVDVLLIRNLRFCTQETKLELF